MKSTSPRGVLGPSFKADSILLASLIELLVVTPLGSLDSRISFVTLTTLGYGDVTPESEIARMLAVTEAITGQLCVATFIARLLSLYLIGNSGRTGPP